MTDGNSRRDLLLGAGAAAAGSMLPPASTPVEAAAPAPAPAAAGVPATLSTAGRPIVPQDFGATGDGQRRPLADRFATLAEARRRFPFVTSLAQSQDWAGLQAALDAVEQRAGRVLVPTGRYVISDTLKVPSQVTLEGESRWGSVIDNQNAPLNMAQITNKDPAAFLYATIRNLSFHGGTHAIAIGATREVAGLVIEGISANLQTVANFHFSSIQTTAIRDCHLIGGRHGIVVGGFPCNSVHLFNTRLGDHSDASLKLNSADLVVMIGGSIEGGGRPGPATIEIGTGGIYANAVAFRHVYFENTHPVLLRSRGARGLSFDGCKFTGAPGANGPAPYRFDCSDDLISFSSNFFGVPTTAPPGAIMVGLNENLRAPAK